MIHNTAVGTALCLGALAGIIDYIRIHIGQIHYGKIRITFFAQAKRLSREPFQGTVFAHMHYRVCFKHMFYPPVIRQIMVGRRQVHVVIYLIYVFQIAARGLNGKKYISIKDPGEMKLAVMNKEITGHFAPVLCHFFSYRFRQGPVPCQKLFRTGMGFSSFRQFFRSQPAPVTRHAGDKFFCQFISGLISPFYAVTLFFYPLQQKIYACEAVQSCGTSDTVVSRGIVVKYNGNLFFRILFSVQPGPVKGNGDHFFNSVRDRHVFRYKSSCYRINSSLLSR